jgi:hypothetical protein
MLSAGWLQSSAFTRYRQHISRPCLILTMDCGMCCFVKTANFDEVKREESQSSMTALRKARRSPKAAAALQRRASLVGDGAKWRITNFKQVARAMSKWA